MFRRKNTYSTNKIISVLNLQNTAPTLNESNVTELKKVKPTNSLYYLFHGPMDCEKQAANITNNSLKAMRANDIRSVSCRYLQNRSGENCTYREVVFYGFLLALAAFLFFYYLPKSLLEKFEKNSDISRNLLNESYRNKQEFFQEAQNALLLIRLLLSVLMFAFSANIPPNICNTLRYKKTKNACKEWLVSKLGPVDFAKIHKLPYDKNGFLKLNRILDEKNIPSTSGYYLPSRFK